MPLIKLMPLYNLLLDLFIKQSFCIKAYNFSIFKIYIYLIIFKRNHLNYLMKHKIAS